MGVSETVSALFGGQLQGHCPLSDYFEIAERARYPLWLQYSITRAEQQHGRVQ